MDRRHFLIALASSASLATPALADRSETRYNFTSAFSPRSGFGGYGGKQVVDYRSAEKPGTIIVDTSHRKLYYVMAGDKAIQYGVGVGRQGFEWSGTARIGNKSEWPQWRPPKEMIARELRQYGRQLPAVMEGGPNNPLGARALYLYQGSRDTLYRIHGTNAPETIGRAVSSGCIRMVNEEVIDLYNRARVGAKVIVL